MRWALTFGLLAASGCSFSVAVGPSGSSSDGREDVGDAGAQEADDASADGSASAAGRGARLGGVAGRTPGCRRAVTGVGAVTPLELIVASKPRAYHLSVPLGYQPNRAYPLVFVFHGAGDTFPQGMRGSLPVEANMPPALFVYPQALPRTRNDGSGGNIPRWDLFGQEDLAFFDAMLEAIGDAYCVDPARVFATGLSSGGNFSQQLGCHRQKALRGFAAVAGPGPFTPPCDGPLAVWMTHDVDDTVLPIELAHDSRAFWTQADGCGTTWTQDSPAPCQRNASCSSGQPLVYCETSGLGHAIPAYAGPAIGAFFVALPP